MIFAQVPPGDACITSRRSFATVHEFKQFRFDYRLPVVARLNPDQTRTKVDASLSSRPRLRANSHIPSSIRTHSHHVVKLFKFCE